MQLLKSLHLKGWKSIKDQSVDFGRVNVLIGANGSGKSNLVSFFPLLAAVSLNDVPRFVSRIGGASTVLHFGPKNTREIVCQLEFENARGVRRYDFNLFFSPGDKMLVAGERFVELGSDSLANDVVHVAVGGQFFRPWEGGQVPDGEPAHEIHGLVGGIRTFHFRDTSDAAEVRLAHYVEDNKELLPEAENLAAVLYLLQKRNPAEYRRIAATVRQGVPGFKDFDLDQQRDNPNRIMLNWRQQDSDYLLGPHQLSDGSIRFIALATLLNQPPEFLPKTIVVDEPELGLHPSALGLLAGMVHSAAVHCQLILATQSPVLLDHFNPEDVIVVQSHDGTSQFERLSSERLKAWLDEYSLSEIWDMNVFGGGPYE